MPYNNTIWWSLFSIGRLTACINNQEQNKIEKSSLQTHFFVFGLLLFLLVHYLDVVPGADHSVLWKLLLFLSVHKELHQHHRSLKESFMSDSRLPSLPSGTRTNGTSTHEFTLQGHTDPEI